jgi:uncharacterized membrane protein YdbT with pleckstrin-like domain
MRYPTEFLTEDETIEKAFRPHWKTLIIPVLWTVLVAITIVLSVQLMPEGWPTWASIAVLLAGWVSLSVLPIIRWYYTIHILTSERLIVRRGIIARQGMEIPLEVVNDVGFSQSVLERLLGFGDVVIESAGELGQSRLSNIPRPQHFHSELYRVREARTLALSGGGGAVDREVATLAQLAELHRQGSLTDDEFRAQKAKLLDSIE